MLFPLGLKGHLMGAKHRYTILSMMKDEGPSLVEWVAYHNHIGFDNICVYTNNCGDGTDDMLIRLEELGYCKHFRNDVPEGKRPQPNALALGTKNEEAVNSDWILTMDADEFVSVKTEDGTIDSLIKMLPDDVDAIAITWRFFGANDITDWNPGLVIENYTRAAPDMFKKGWGVKTMFKPYDDMKLGIHRPHIKKAKQMPERAKALFEQKWVNGSLNPMPDEFSLSGWRSTKPTLGYEYVELNHYGVKSYEAYLLRRVRGNVNLKEDKYDAAYFSLFNRNEEEVTNVTRHAEPVKKIMAEILADPKMAELQEKALEFHEARVQKLRTTGEYETWVAQLKETTKISIDKLDEVLFVQHLPKEWQAKVKELQAQGVPDKTIAKMIAQTQTAKKGETRQALMAAAGEASVEDSPERAARKARKAAEAATLDNPFLNTPEAAALGVPQMSEDVQKMKALATNTDDEDEDNNPDDPSVVDELGLVPGMSIGEQLRNRVAKIKSPDGTVRTVKITSASIPSSPSKTTTSRVPSPAAVPPMKRATTPQGALSDRMKTPVSQPNGNRTLVSTMKNEGPYVLEWLAYHASIGINKFCIFSNDCTDGTNLLLNRLDQMGIVDHYDNPQGPRMDPQRSAYSRANKMSWVKNSEWVLIVDADEFLNIHVGDGSLDALIEASGEADAISLNWRLMGSCGEKHMDPTQLVSERFTRGSTFEEPENGLVWGFKTMFRPDKFDFFGVHRPKFTKETKRDKSKIIWRNGDGELVGGKIIDKGWRSSKDSLGYKNAQVNHYAIKSREDFLLKRLRGTANSKNKDRIDMEYWDKYDINTNEDTSIDTSAVREIMNDWLSDPDLAGIHRAVLETTRRALEYQLRVDDYQKFVDTGEWKADKE